jgi:UDP-2-acetamido-3-amino-2,3-dideoxy-glucuronate N-acetyltransferase
MDKKLCVIGGGRWGQNHIKTLYETGNLGGIVENNESRLKELMVLYPVKGFINLADAMKESFDGFVVATPAQTHYEIGKLLLENRRHTLIEKPMTLSSEESQELVEIAQRNDTRLMVGHVLLFHPAVKKIKEIVHSGKIGKLYYLYSTRLNFGTVRTEENVFWSFAPHDISVLNYITGQPPVELYSTGSRCLQDKICDVAVTQLVYAGNINAYIFVSWLHPFKEQRLVVVGSKGMISFEDSSKEKSVKVYNKQIYFEGGIPKKLEEPDEILEYEKSQPLKNELQYFIDNLDKKIEIADGKSGHEVVKILEQTRKFLDIR